MRSFKAFISYKHARSTRFAEHLELAIKAYAKPLYERPMSVFRDEKHLRPGMDLPGLIQEALYQSEYLIFLASPEAAASPWVISELNLWCEDEDRRRRLIIVLTDGTIAVDAESKRLDWERTNALPRALAGTIAVVPLYVDLSWAQREDQQTLLNPDYKKAVNAIVATLRDVDPIQLSGQEIIQHRRNIRIRNGFVAAIGVLAILLAAAAWFAWHQMLAAEARAREATSRRLAAEADRLAESRIDTALLLMAQAYRMSDNPPLRESWWRLLGAETVPAAYLTSRAADLRFEPHGQLAVTSGEAQDIYVLTDGTWQRTTSSTLGSIASSAQEPDWIWSGGCEDSYCDDASGVWECAEAESRIIGPYGDQDSFCVRSRIRVPDWCGAGAIEVPGFEVRARRSADRVIVETDRGSASYACVVQDDRTGDGPQPVLIAGAPIFFTALPGLEVMSRSGAQIQRLSRSFDGRWLAILRIDGGVEVWPLPVETSPRGRLGATVLKLPVPVLAVAASRSGAVAVALAAVEGEAGDILFWRRHTEFRAGRDADLTIARAWPGKVGRPGVLALSPEGDRIVAGADVALAVWDTASGQKVGEDAYIGRHVATSASLASHGTLLAVVPRPLDGALASGVWIFEPMGGPERFRLETQAESVAFDPSVPDLLYTAGERGVQAWRKPTQGDGAVPEPATDKGAAAGALRVERVLSEKAAHRLAIDPDHRRLAITLADRQMMVLDLEPRASAIQSGRRTTAAAAVALLSTGHVLLSASNAGLEAWDWPADAWFTIDSRPHSQVVALPDGGALALAGDQAVIYDLDPAHWLQLTCAIVGRNLTLEEWRTHFGSGFPYETACPADLIR